MEQVAAAAGVSRVTLYSHVGSRAQLLERVLADHVELALADLRGCSLDSDARTALAELTRCSWESVGAVEALRAEVLAEVGEPAVARAHDRVVEHIAAIIASGQAAGSLTTDAEPGWLARCYFALVSQAARENEAAERVIDGLVTAVAALLGVREGRLDAAPLPASAASARP